jgi:hypothetical protein
VHPGGTVGIKLAGSAAILPYDDWERCAVYGCPFIATAHKGVGAADAHPAHALLVEHTRRPGHSDG